MDWFPVLVRGCGCVFAKKAGKRCCSHAVGIERGHFKLIRRLVHRIKGAGGGYVTHWACRLNGWSDSTFQEQIENLQQYTAALSQRFGDG